MQNNIWYNGGMVKNYEKKGEPLSLKLQPSLLDAIKEISLREDRPVGYVAREFMIRGLHSFLLDGRIKTNSAEETFIAQNSPAYKKAVSDLKEASGEPKKGSTKIEDAPITFVDDQGDLSGEEKKSKKKPDEKRKR